MTEAERQAQRDRIETLLCQLERRWGVRRSVDDNAWIRFLAEHPELEPEEGRDA